MQHAYSRMQSVYSHLKPLYNSMQHIQFYDHGKQIAGKQITANFSMQPVNDCEQAANC
jgi:hypothetical protein